MNLSHILPPNPIQLLYFLPTNSLDQFWGLGRGRGKGRRGRGTEGGGGEGREGEGKGGMGRERKGEVGGKEWMGFHAGGDPVFMQLSAVARHH